MTSQQRVLAACEFRRPDRIPRLIPTGGMCNTHTLVRGDKAAIEAEAREIIDLGRDGGVVIGTHSVSPEIPLENFLAYHECCLSYGTSS
jgi:uroporphyrinogen-III decarboxylase